MSRVRLTQLVTQLSAHPGLGPLASSLSTLAQSAWRARDVVFPRPGSPTLLAADLPAPELLLVGEVDLSEIYRMGARSSEELDALTALTLLGVSAAWPKPSGSCSELGQCLLWLETYSGMRCLTACGAVLDGALQRRLAEAVLALLEGSSVNALGLSSAEFEIGRSWLLSVDVPECNDLAQRAKELAPSAVGTRGVLDQPIVGDLSPRPRHPLTIALLAITGILFVLRAGRGLGRLILRRRAPTSVWISERGLELFSRYEMLGRVLLERRMLVPIEDIRTVEREVRFPRFGLYGGLLALALGTLLGTRLFIDGLRVAGLSFPLIVIGLVCVTLGILLDMLLSGLGDSLRGRCRLLVVPRRGRGWAIGELEQNSVDRLLTELSTQLAARRQ